MGIGFVVDVIMCIYKYLILHLYIYIYIYHLGLFNTVLTPELSFGTWPHIRTSRGTEEAAAENTQFINSSMEMNYSYIFRELVIFIFYCILDTTNVVKTCDYLYLNKEIHFGKPLEMFVPGAGRKLRNKNSVNQSWKMPLYYLFK